MLICPEAIHTSPDVIFISSYFEITSSFLFINSNFITFEFKGKINSIKVQNINNLKLEEEGKKDLVIVSAENQEKYRLRPVRRDGSEGQ